MLGWFVAYFTDFQSSCWSLLKNIWCSKSGTEEVTAFLPESFLSPWSLPASVYLLGLFPSHSPGAGDRIRLRGSFPAAVRLPFSVRLVQHHRPERSVPRPAESVGHSAEAAPRSQRPEEVSDWRNGHKISSKNVVLVSSSMIITHILLMITVITSECLNDRHRPWRSPLPTKPRPHTAASPPTSAASLSRRSRPRITLADCSRKGS